jgi:hypothetical protein
MSECRLWAIWTSPRLVDTLECFRDRRIALLNASDLYIDDTQVVRPPSIIASSNWYRPILLELIGLAAGLGLTLLIAIIAVIQALGKNSKKSNKEAKVLTPNNDET